MHVCALSAKNPKRVVALPENNYRALLVPSVIAVSVTLIDQITKIWAVDFLSIKGSVEILGKFLMLTLVYNEGGALGTNFGPSIYYLLISVLIFVLIIYYIIVHRQQKIIVYPLSFIAGGAIGNIIDRIRIGKVVDWIDVDFPDFNIFGYHLDRWWTFNIADAAISCSIVFIVATMLMTKFSHHIDIVDKNLPDSDNNSKTEQN